jgi:hypothetical protein
VAARTAQLPAARRDLGPPLEEPGVGVGEGSVTGGGALAPDHDVVEQGNRTRLDRPRDRALLGTLTSSTEPPGLGATGHVDHLRSRIGIATLP